MDFSIKCPVHRNHFQAVHTNRGPQRQEASKNVPDALGSARSGGTRQQLWAGGPEPKTESEMVRWFSSLNYISYQKYIMTWVKELAPSS